MKSELVATQTRLDEVMEKATKAAVEGQPVGLDFEGTGLNPGKDQVVGLSLAVGEEAWYIPLGHKKYLQNLTLEAKHKELLEKLPVTCYSSSYERKFALRQWGVELNVVGDGQLLSRMLQMRTYNLTETAEKLQLGGKSCQLATLTDNSYDFSQLNPLDPNVLLYATRDAYLAVQVERKLQDTLDAKEGKYSNWREVYKVELGAQQALAPMEARGVGINLPALPKIIDRMGRWLEKEAAAIHEMIGSDETFKLNSPKRLAEQLFEAENGPKLEGYMQTKTGYSTSMDHLEMLRDQHPAVARLIEWKHQFAVFTRDITRVKDWTVNGRVYPSFQTLGVDATGRIYATDPSITQFSEELRDLVIPDEGHVFVHWDWRQAEVRIIAIMSGDENLLEIFESGRDCYKQVAARIFQVPEDAVTKEDRDKAKVIMLAYLYGTQGYSIARVLKCSRDEADKLLYAFRCEFPKVEKWYRESYDAVMKRGDAYTILGRRRTVAQEMFKTRSGREKAALGRSNVNFRVQSSCGGDLLKMTMKEIHDEMKKYPEMRTAYAFCPVFDAVAYHVPKAGLEKFLRVLSMFTHFRLVKCEDGCIRPSFHPAAQGREGGVAMEVEVKVSGESWAKVKAA